MIFVRAATTNRTRRAGGRTLSRIVARRARVYVFTVGAATASRALDWLRVLARRVVAIVARSADDEVTISADGAFGRTVEARD